ncbi:MAG: AtpZ/AtpI family protein [Acidobacteria bacterium]|nr:AtpZ/AtpI family protein [Acidobacteriota bacterium]
MGRSNTSTGEGKQELPGGGANEALQESLDQSEPRIMAAYALIGAILLLGGIGYAVDRWAGTSPWFLIAGLIAGIVVGFWNLVRSLRAG